jgi:DNA ligase (NAD+)
MPRSAAEAQARALGATTTDSVTRKTTHLVTGTDLGASKLLQAQRYGTRIMTEEEFQELISDARQD